MRSFQVSEEVNHQAGWKTVSDDTTILIEKCPLHIINGKYLVISQHAETKKYLLEHEHNPEIKVYFLTPNKADTPDDSSDSDLSESDDSASKKKDDFAFGVYDPLAFLNYNWVISVDGDIFYYAAEKRYLQEYYPPAEGWSINYDKMSIIETHYNAQDNAKDSETDSKAAEDSDQLQPQAAAASKDLCSMFNGFKMGVTGGCDMKNNELLRTFKLSKRSRIEAQIWEEMKQLSAQQKQQMDELKSKGYHKEVMNCLKLRLYDWDVEKVMKFYETDEFCYDYTIFGSCSKMKRCAYKHVNPTVEQVCSTDEKNDYDYEYCKYVCEHLLCIEYYNEKVYPLYAKVLLKLNNYDEAAAVYHKLLEMGKPEDRKPSLHNGLALVLRASNKFAEAQKHFEEAIKFAPGNSSYCSNMAELLIEMGKFDESLKYSRKAQKLKPNGPMASLMLGDACYELKRWRESLEAYENVIASGGIDHGTNERVKTSMEVAQNAMKMKQENRLKSAENVIKALKEFNIGFTQNVMVPDETLARVMKACGGTISLIAAEMNQNGVESEAKLDNSDFVGKYGMDTQVLDKEWQQDAHQLERVAQKMAPNWDLSQYQESMKLVTKMEGIMSNNFDTRMADIKAQIVKNQDALAKEQNVLKKVETLDKVLTRELNRKISLCDTLARNASDAVNELIRVSSSKTDVVSNLNKNKVNLSDSKCKLAKLEHEKRLLSVSISEYQWFESSTYGTINKIRSKYDEKWKELEQRWYTWNVDDIIFYLKNKLESMDCKGIIGDDMKAAENELDWELIKSNMENEKFKGKYLNSIDRADLKLFGVGDFIHNKNIFIIIQNLCQNNPIVKNVNIVDKNDENGEIEVVPGQRNSNVDKRFLCALSNEIMSSPVVAYDGKCYEKDQIVKYLRQNKRLPGQTDLVVDVELAISMLHEKKALKAEIESKCA